MDKRYRPAHKLASPSRVMRLAERGLDRADWYDRAVAEIALVCSLEGWQVNRFTDILAILSPRVSIRRNVRATLAYVGQGVHFHTTMRAIKQGLSNYLETGIVGGHKVSCFARALHGDQEAITLDTWMSYALQDVPSPTVKHFRRQATMHGAHKLVRGAAKRLGISPRDCQACIWSGIFRETGQTPQHYPIMQEYDNWVSQNRSFPASGVITGDTPEADKFEIETILQEAIGFDQIETDDASFDVANFSCQPAF